MNLGPLPGERGHRDPIAYNRTIDRLNELGERTRYSGGKARARGICHDARDVGAVSIERGRNGGVVVYCHACNGNDAFLQAIGFTQADLYDDNPSGAVPAARAGGNDWTPCKAKGHKLVAEYVYQDEQRCTVHGVARCDHKCFWQWRPDTASRSGRTWSVNDKTSGERLVRLVPYRLPEIKAAVAAEQVIWIVEGEKDVHALVDRGIPATCNAAGSGKWTTEHARHLQGADITIVADRDKAGREHAELVVETLQSIARSVYVVQARHGKDAFDHFAGGGTTGDFIEVWAPKPFTVEMAGAGR